MKRFLLPLLFLALGLSARGAESNLTRIVHGTAIDPGSGKVMPQATITIEGDHITAVREGEETERADGAKRIDASGKFILPGYIDTHVHFFQSGDLYTRPDVVDLTSVRSYADEHAWIERNLRDTFARYLRCGITSVVDVGGPMWNFKVRELAESVPKAPRVAVAGPLISSVARPQLVLNDDPPIVKIDTPEEGVQLVQKLAKHNPDYIKIWYVVSPESPVEKLRPIVHAVTQESHRLKLRVAVHATELEAARAAVEEGADLLVHSVTDKPVDAAFVKLLQERGTILTPTLVVFERYGRTFANRLNLTPEEKAWGNPQVIASLDVTRLPPAQIPDRIKSALADPDAMLARVQQTYDVALKNLKTLQDAGVTIAAGTDAGNIGTIHGPALFREFQLMKEAGLTPMQILKSATANAAKTFGGETGAKIGAIAPGKFADLVILNSNPLEDIAHASDIETVIKDGVAYPAKAILDQTAASAANETTPGVDRIAEQYARLVLALGQHDPDYVDAFYGPAEWKSAAEKEKQPLEAIARAANQLRDALAQVPALADEISQLRTEYLNKQLSALAARVRILQGERLTFDDESRALYDAVAPTFPDSHFQQILDQLAQRLPGDGPLWQRYEAWRKPFVIPKEKLDSVFQLAIAECQKRTLAHMQLPPNESFTVEYVTEKPWGGYNWYKGNYRSVIQVNTDVPAYIDRAIDLAAHEGYPGHHVYNALLEKNLVHDRGWQEFTVYPLFSPQSLIAEGTANFGKDVVFTPAERMKFEKEVLFPAAGIDPARADEYYALQKMTQDLSYAANEAARRLINGEIDGQGAADWLQKFALMDEKRAQQRVKFIERYRSYVINYNLGEGMVRHYIERRGGTADQSEKRWSEFERLLSSPRLPSGLQ